MRRIVVVGAAGSGKTSAATEIARRLELPRVELDALYWGRDWTPVDNDLLRERFGAAAAGDEWVIDLTKRTVVRRVFTRTMRRAALRTKLWSGNRESIRNSFLARDSILRFVCNEYPKYRNRYRTLQVDPAWSHLEWIRCAPRVRCVRGSGLSADCAQFGTQAVCRR